MNFTLRPATPGDAMAIAQAHLESWKTTYPGIIPQAYIDALNVENGVRNWQQRLEENSRHIFVAEDESGIFGFICGGPIREPIPGYDGRARRHLPAAAPSTAAEPDARWCSCLLAHSAPRALPA